MHGLNGLDAWVVGLMVGAVWLACAQKSRVAASHAKRRAAGRPISQFYCQIAAIAFAHGVGVGTRNIGDYEGCGISLIDPWAKPRAQ